MSKPNGILAMSPDQYREIDGVVFDLDSFAKHCGPAETSQPDTIPPPEADAIPAPAGILALDPAHYRALDGVVMDQDSYERHCCPPPAPEPAAAEPETAAPHGVFACDPFPAGWYPTEDGQPPVPRMGGALPPAEVIEQDGHTVTVIRTVIVRSGSGSGSGSYLTSYTTSYRTSRTGSGSGSYRYGSCTSMAGGYGLELV